MSGPGPSDGRPTVGWVAAPNQRIPQLATYLATNLGRFTVDALRESAREAGYTPEEIDTALRLANERLAIRPIRGRARWIVLAAYLAVWALFATQYLRPQTSSYGFGGAYQAILTGALFVGFLISVGWLAWRKPDPTRVARAMVIFLVVPVVLLVGIAGACLPFVRYG
jgi:hypothetical protein